MTTHTTFYQRPNGDEPDIEIEVEFTLTGGHGGSAPSLSDPGEPPEPPEMEITDVFHSETGAPLTLSDDEDAAVREDVMSRLGDFDDLGDEDF